MMVQNRLKSNYISFKANTNIDKYQKVFKENIVWGSSFLPPV
jgi:hypothetical protein